MGGYFQFENSDNGLYFNVYADANGQKNIKMDDIIYYIDKAKISECDLIEIKKAISSPDKHVRVRVGEKSLPINEFGEYKISTDLLRSEVVFYPGFVGTSDITFEEVIRDMHNLGIKFGIDEDAVKSFFENKEYCKPYVVARGVAPVDGIDGYITYKFETEKKAKPKINDDGSVDFHDLDALSHVKKGDVLAVITPVVDGVPGTDVFGRSIAPRKAKKAVFKYGKNLKVSEDGLNLITDVSGHATLESGKVFVSNLLELVNVDASTGDINYDGNVVVSGNVLAGFSIKASGNIEIRGIVEGANVEAGGDLILVRGVQGMGKANVKCGGNLVSKFIESAASVSVGGTLETDSILHSKVEAQGNITVTGKNGLIIGGDVRSTILIYAKFVGNTMGTNTVVGVGVDPANKRKVEVLKKEIVSLNENKEKMNQIITALRKKQDAEGSLEPEKLELLQKSTRNLIMVEHDMMQKRKEFDELNQLIYEDNNARIKIARTMYPGTKVVFGDIYMFIKNKFDYCQFLKSGADIKSIPL